MSFTSSDIIAQARLWLGTPYRHQASMRGAGADCLGLVRGVWRTLLGHEPELPPPYAPDWDMDDGEALQKAAERHLVRLAGLAPQPGDILLFRLRMAASARHMAIATAPDTIIHAYSGVCVSETALGPWWRRRLVARYAFPGSDQP